MNLSEASDGESSDESSVAAQSKRLRANNYGASPSTSHSSVAHDPENETPESETNDNYNANFQKPAKIHFSERNSEENTLRLSMSENCSSPNEVYDDFRPSFEDNGETMRPSFQDSDSFYSKSLNEKNFDDAYSGEYSEKSKRMMSNMGFKPGKGLGKFEHGRIEPVEASTQRGRRGLGLKPSIVGELPKDFQWTPEDEIKPEAKEEVLWLPSAAEDPPLGDVLEKWLIKGPRKMTVDDETNFVNPHILKGILEAKTIFDSLDDADLRRARFRSNPYETIGAAIFLNRAAVKMANIDAVFDFMFTNPRTPAGEDQVDKKEILYFVDVCAGPGGFSEYVLYRKGWRSKGFGFTLRGPNDFKLSDFYAGPPETFNPYYGVNDDGNIFDPANLTSLKERVLKQTDDKGVHFLMGDGGFSVEGQENLQEVLSKQLYLCQCLAALMLVRTGGHFVVKLFDVFTPFSVGLIYIMYRCFEKVCIHKPVTSRPANSERYLICHWKRVGTESVERHLISVNSILWNGLESEDVLQLVPMSVLQEDTSFFEYIYKSNCLIGETQIKNLLKIAAFSKDKNLRENSQAEMKEECLKLWQIPDQVRIQPDKLSPDETLMKTLSLTKRPPPECNNPHTFKSGVLNKQPEYLENPVDLNKIRNVYDWHFMFLSSGKNSPDLRIFLGCGGKQVFQLEHNGWRSLVDLQLTLPAKTLIYGEIVKEFKGEGNNQIYIKALHIIDAMVLGGIDISHYALSERINQCNLFCTAISKPFDIQALPVRCKRLFNMELFSTAINNLEYRAMKRVKKAVTINTPDRINRTEMFYVVGSIVFIKEIREPWSGQISKSSGFKYYFSIGKDKKPRSEYYLPQEAVLDMLSGYSGRLVWPWEPSASAILDGHAQGGLTRTHMDDFISQNVKR